MMDSCLSKRNATQFAMDLAVCIPFCANILGKDRNPSLLPPTMG